jgi:hypothetical protein
MGKKKSSSKSKEALVGEEASLSVIENREFVAMRAMEKLWPVPTTMEDQLHDLVRDGLIQVKDFADWKVPCLENFFGLSCLCCFLGCFCPKIYPLSFLQP